MPAEGPPILYHSFFTLLWLALRSFDAPMRENQYGRPTAVPLSSR